VPSAFLANVQHLVTARDGRILGYGEKAGWDGWDELTALMPEVELHDLIIELRSQTLGLGTYVTRFDHYAESRRAVPQLG
jgi:elongation factor G